MKRKILIADSKDSPADIVRPVSAALSALDAEVVTIDLGRLGSTQSRLGRVVQAIIGEAEAGQLVRALTTSPPDVALAFDPDALAALAVARDRRKASTVVLGVVPDLSPTTAWTVEADRFAAVDDEAAVALSEQGVEGARIAVTGPVVGHALHGAAGGARSAARAALSLPADLPVVLVDTRDLSLEELSQVTLQLSLFDRKLYVLFDAGGSSEVAALVRKQVPGLGLKGKLFGETSTAASLWRSADTIIGRATPRAVHLALAMATPLVALPPRNPREEGEAGALADRHLGGQATRILLLAAALEPFVAKATSSRRGPARDGAAEIADLVVQLATQRDEILAESPSRVAAPPPISEAAAEEPEDLGGDGEHATSTVGPELDDLFDRVDNVERRMRRELDESRAEAEKWEQRKLVAEAKGDTKLAQEAAREADRKRARMHLALEELGRLAAQKGHIAGKAAARPASGPTAEDDALAALKRKAAAAGAGAGAPGRPRTLDDELAALKRKMEAEKKRR